MEWALSGDQAVPKAVAIPKLTEKEPAVPTLTRLAHVHARISKGFAPYEATNIEHEENATDLMTLAASESRAISPAKLDSATKEQRQSDVEAVEKPSNILVASPFTPTRKTRYAASPSNPSISSKSGMSATKKLSPDAAKKMSITPTSSKRVKSRQPVTNKSKGSQGGYMGHTVLYKQKVKQLLSYQSSPLSPPHPFIGNILHNIVCFLP